MVAHIVKRFKPERVILFGSQARGSAGPDSDVDLLVVMDLEEGASKREKQLEIQMSLGNLPVSTDILVTTPTDFEWRRRIPGTIERPAALEGEVLYSARAGGTEDLGARTARSL